MRTDEIERRIDALKQRLAGLQAHAEEGDELLTEALPRILADASALLQDLQAAQEELTARDKALVADLQRYQELFDRAPAGYLVTDLEGAIQAANRIAAALLEPSGKPVVGTPLVLYVTEEDQQAFRDEVAQFRSGAEVRRWKVHLKRRGGQPYAAAVTVAAARDAGAHLVGLRWLFQGVAEHDRTIESLQRSHDALESRVREGAVELAEATTALETEIHEHARTEANLAHRQDALEAVYRIATTASPSVEAISDQVVLNVSELLNVPSAVIRRVEKNKLTMLSSFVNGTLSHGGDAPLTCGPCALVHRDKIPQQSTGALRERFSESRCFRNHDFKSYAGVPVKDTSGRITGVLCVMDYAERVFSEEDIHLIEIFAQYVANEFERDDTERRMVELQRFQVLGQLTSGVAHEIRNPLNAILIMAEALEARLEDAPHYTNYLGRIRTQVNRLSSLMQDLLDFGKPLQLTRLQRASLSAICADAVALWQQSAPENRQTVRLVPPPDFPNVTVLADVGRLEQVFINLIGNAAQHSAEQSEILVSIQSPDGNAVCVHVVDRGRGIAHEDFSRVFEPFFTTRKHGTGLGLALVKHIVQAHHGDVTLWNNDPPPGCTVEVRLPREPEP